MDIVWFSNYFNQKNIEKGKGVIPFFLSEKSFSKCGIIETGDTMTKIAIVEDDKELRTELQILLENHGYETFVLETFTAVKESLLQSKADLILLDIHIPGMPGDYLLRELRKTSNIPVIMVTSQNNEVDEIMSMSFGADDYITKPYHPKLLLLRIEAVLKRSKQVGETLTYKNVTLHISKSTLETQEKSVLLSKNEFRIFYYLVTHVSKIVSREELMDYLWSTDSFIDDNTLTVNMTRLRNKLEEMGLKDVIETRRGQGYLLV